MKKQRLTVIIAEFNPYHTGHRYLMEQAKLLGDDVLIIMSGSFVQRGEVALLDPYTRAKWAIAEGAKIVIELPFSGSVAPAEIFAEFSFKLLDGINSDITLLFGSEDGDIDRIITTATLLYEEPKELKYEIKKNLDKGTPYPKAVSDGLKSYADKMSIAICDISKPNNSLAVEYCKANLKRNGKYLLKTVKRKGSYNDTKITELPSSTAIRKLLEMRKFEETKELVPAVVYSDFSRLKSAHDSSILFVSGVLDKTKEELQALFDVDVKEGLENRLLSKAQSCCDYQTLISEIKTKRYTMARIKRILVYALLGYTKKDAETSLSEEEPLYNVLACDKNSKQHLLSIFSNKPITSMNELENDYRIQAKYTVKAHKLGKLFWGYQETHCSFE